jgi:hypothetical protein
MSGAGSSRNAVVIHPLDPEDAPTISRMEAAVRPFKGVPWKIEGPCRVRRVVGSVRLAAT